MSGVKIVLGLLPALFVCGVFQAGSATPHSCYSPGSPVHISSECLQDIMNWEIGEMNWGRTNGTTQDAVDDGAVKSGCSRGLYRNGVPVPAGEELEGVLYFEIGDIDWGRKPGGPASANGSSGRDGSELE